MQSNHEETCTEKSTGERKRTQERVRNRRLTSFDHSDRFWSYLLRQLRLLDEVETCGLLTNLLPGGVGVGGQGDGISVEVARHAGWLREWLIFYL